MVNAFLAIQQQYVSFVRFLDKRDHKTKTHHLQQKHLIIDDVLLHIVDVQLLDILHNAPIHFLPMILDDDTLSKRAEAQVYHDHESIHWQIQSDQDVVTCMQIHIPCNRIHVYYKVVISKSDIQRVL